jgi:Inner membrane component domain
VQSDMSVPCRCRPREAQVWYPMCRLIFFGWPLFLGHVASALVQIPTIIGIPTAVTQLQMAKFALWPFGQGDRSAGSIACLHTACLTGCDLYGMILFSRLLLFNVCRRPEALSAQVHGGSQRTRRGTAATRLAGVCQQRRGRLSALAPAIRLPVPWFCTMSPHALDPRSKLRIAETAVMLLTVSRAWCQGCGRQCGPLFYLRS